MYLLPHQIKIGPLGSTFDKKRIGGRLPPLMVEVHRRKLSLVAAHGAILPGTTNPKGLPRELLVGSWNQTPLAPLHSSLKASISALGLTTKPLPHPYIALAIPEGHPL